LNQSADAVYSLVLPRLYSLSEYVDKQFIGIAVEGDASLVIVSSDRDSLDKALNIVTSALASSRVEGLEQSEIHKLVNEVKHRKYLI